MEEKDVNLFNRAIHQIKDLMGKINTQRKGLDADIKELNEIVGELYQLFDDLYGENKK